MQDQRRRAEHPDQDREHQVQALDLPFPQPGVGERQHDRHHERDRGRVEATGKFENQAEDDPGSEFDRDLHAAGENDGARMIPAPT